jgi:hypothetical protein
MAYSHFSGPSKTPVSLQLVEFSFQYFINLNKSRFQGALGALVSSALVYGQTDTAIYSQGESWQSLLFNRPIQGWQKYHRYQYRLQYRAKISIPYRFRF